MSSAKLAETIKIFQIAISTEFKRKNLDADCRAKFSESARKAAF